MLFLGVWMIGCFHGVPVETSRPDEAPITSEASLVVLDGREAPQPPQLVARDPGTTIFVAGCNRGCVDCGLGNYKTYVVGIQGGRRVFPPASPAPGYSCATQAAIGERVTLRAHSPEGFVIAGWETPFQGDYCPCEGTTASVCHVDITPEVVARYDRVYCGAHWASKHVVLAH